MAQKIIGHLDMDAFFASVEERDKPWLRGLPIVVGADPNGGLGRGVVSTANYKARKYGIRSALPISKAWEYSEMARKRGESAVAFITPSSPHYRRESAMVMQIVRRFAPLIESVSIDEVYIDLTFCHSFRKAEHFARIMKQAIKREQKLTASIGIGENRMLAKIASDFSKPDGLGVILPSRTLSFLAPLSVRVIPGIGPKAESILKKSGVQTIQELRKLSWQTLSSLLGSHGFDIYQSARGIAHNKVEPKVAEALSIGENKTFMTDTRNLRFVMAQISKMTSRIVTKVMQENFSGFRTVVLTVRFSDFETKSRSLTSNDMVTKTSELEHRIIKLLLPFFERKENPHQKNIRMIGIRVEKLI